MEDLVKNKEQEIEKLTQVKEALRNQVTKIKSENKALKAELESLKNSRIPSNKKDSDLIKANIRLKSENTTLKVKIDELNKEIVILEQIKESNQSKINKLEPSSEDKPLSTETLLKQLKNGMFSIGKQHVSIESKLDKILDNLSEQPISSQPVASAASTGYTSPAYSSPGLSQSNYDATPKPSSLSANKNARKPSDILKPANTANLSSDISKESKPVQVASSGNPKQEKVNSAKQSIMQNKASGMGGDILTIPYPDDGAIKCPKCGKQEFAEQENKMKVLSYVPIKKYAKLYYCKACRSKWDY